jgi:hypothetical protein
MKESRRELLELLELLSNEFPEMRLGQLLSNLTTAAGKTEASAIWDVEDDELLPAARRWLERRGTTVVSQEGSR